MSCFDFCWSSGCTVSPPSPSCACQVPFFASISPDIVALGGSMGILIVGTSFSESATVNLINGATVYNIDNFSVSSDGMRIMFELDMQTQSIPVGTYRVNIINGPGCSVTGASLGLHNTLLIQDCSSLSITDISPQGITAGNTGVITGSGFTGSAQVQLTDVLGNVTIIGSTVVSSTEIDFVTPSVNINHNTQYSVSVIQGGCTVTSSIPITVLATF